MGICQSVKKTNKTGISYNYQQTTQNIIIDLNNSQTNTTYDQIKDQILDYGYQTEIKIQEEKTQNPNNFIELKDTIKEKDSNEQLYALGQLGLEIEKMGVNVVISKNNSDGKANIINNQIISSGMLNQSKYEIHVIEENEEQKFNVLNNNSEQKNFIKKWKKILSKETGIPEELISIKNLREGTITFDVLFKTEDFTNSPNYRGEEVKINERLENFANNHSEIKEIHQRSLISTMMLTLDMLDSRGNQYPGNWAGEGETRGGYEYFPPGDDWIGYGLKVMDVYDNGNNDWLAMDGNPNEWAVAYHGTSSGAIKSICNGKFYSTRQEAPWGAHKCEFSTNINPLTQAEFSKCGEGAYCSPHLEYAYGYYNGAMLMCRVNPKQMRIPEDYAENEWITDGTKNSIRPYRILVKK